jgi:hypothetical protein
MTRDNKAEVLDVLFGALDNPAESLHDTSAVLGAFVVLSHPENYGVSFAVARDLPEPISAPFERRSGGAFPRSNRVAIVREDYTSLEGVRRSVFSFHATSRRNLHKR